MNRSLVRRIVASAVVSIALVVALIALVVSLARPAILRASVANLSKVVDLDDCVADPERWGWASGDLSFFAYDRTGRSANPRAPAVDDERLRGALAGEVAIADVGSSRMVALVPAALDGPCALMRLSSANAATVVRPRLLAVLSAATIGGMLLAAFGTLWLVVEPLRARIAALADAARGVGDEGFSGPPTGPGPLGLIADTLARSHQRIVDARGALEARNRALEDHLAGIAHDLRTPLSSMQLAIEVLAVESRGELREEARRALADGVYLSALVENLHQATRLRYALDVTAGEVDLAELVRRLERRFAVVGRHANIAVAAHAPDEPVRVACTPALAERAIANLIQNAIEHNPGPGHVAVVLSVADDGDRFSLVVADDGPGLPESERATLESESFLLDQARARGPGLGMLITGEVARRAGWSIRYASREPFGLRVVVGGALSA